VVLVDADLRRPSLHRLFRVPNDYGLADLLRTPPISPPDRGGYRGGASINKAMKSTSVEGLALITAGADIDNPWALLRNAHLQKLIEDLKNVADFVLVDVPSAIVFADAATVASVVDGVIVVVRANESPRGSEFQIKGLLNKANANMLGVVLTHVPPTEVDSCHYYAHYYATPNMLRPTPSRPGRPPDETLASTRDGSASGDSDDYALDDDGRM
jgi:capsular exopolysaccharide synthesis family protein